MKGVKIIGIASSFHELHGKRIKLYMYPHMPVLLGQLHVTGFARVIINI